MGDRIGIKVIDDDGNESEILLHSHWLGPKLIKYCQIFLKEIYDTPLKEAYADYILTKFIVWMAVNHYDDCDELNVQIEDDDCDDNGVWYMDMRDGTVC